MRRQSPAALGGRGQLLAVLLVALNLRGAIAAVSPVLPAIRADLSLSAAAAGLLTTLPVLCFAAAAPAAAWLARRTTVERSILIGCLAIAAGTLLRTLGGTVLLMTGTLAIGVAMTLGNVLVPVVVKRDFHSRASTVTGLYTAALAGGAAASAALTAPIAAAWGWRTGLAVWALLALGAAVVWGVAVDHRRDDVPRNSDHATTARPPAASGRSSGLWRQQVAWAVALFLGFQSVCYYSVTAWLPTLLVDTVGVDLATAGLAMSVFQILGIGGTLLVPLLVHRRPAQSGLGLAIAAGWVVTVSGLLAAPSLWWVWVTVGGVAQGAGISFAFTVLVLRARDTAAARSLSSMSQLIGYSLGAAGPFVVGWLYGVTEAWVLPLVVLVTVAACQGLAGFAAGRDRTVGSEVASVSR